MVALEELNRSGKPPRKDLTGHRFGRLMVKEWAGRDEYSRSFWNCECDCKKNLLTRAEHLIRSRTKSCKCLVVDMSTKHGLYKNPIYRIWASIKDRCLNLENNRYSDYGARGIGVFEGWIEDPEAFCKYVEEYLGEPETPQHSIDRINNNLGYYPGNIRWADKSEQNNNRRNTVWITFNGETKPLGVFAKEYNLNPSVLLHRIKILGWDIEKALTTPVRHKSKSKKAA